MKKLVFLFSAIIMMASANAQHTTSFFTGQDSLAGGGWFCKPTADSYNVIFYDNSSSTIGPITKWLWIFSGAINDTIVSNTNDPVIATWNATGNFTVKLFTTVYDSTGEILSEVGSWVGIHINYTSVEIPEDTIYNLGTPVVITANGYPSGGLYKWKNQSSSMWTLGNPFATTDAGNFIVNYDKNGCVALDTVTILPDIITGINDPIPFSQEKGFQIFDLNGKKVFSSSKESDIFPTRENTNLPTGIYIEIRNNVPKKILIK